MYQYRNLHLLEIPFKNKSEKDFLILDFIVVVVQSLSRVSLRPHGLQHASLPCTSPSPGICSNSCPSSRWCRPTISYSVVPFSCLQSFPASRSFSMSWLFTSGSHSVGVSASVLPMNIQDWFPLGWTGLSSLLSKGLSRVFFSTTIWKHQFLTPSLRYGSCTSICDCWKKKILWLYRPLHIKKQRRLLVYV